MAVAEAQELRFVARNLDQRRRSTSPKYSPEHALDAFDFIYANDKVDRAFKCVGWSGDKSRQWSMMELLDVIDSVYAGKKVDGAFDWVHIK